MKHRIRNSTLSWLSTTHQSVLCYIIRGKWDIKQGLRKKITLDLNPLIWIELFQGEKLSLDFLLLIQIWQKWDDKTESHLHQVSRCCLSWYKVLILLFQKKGYTEMMLNLRTLCRIHLYLLAKKQNRNLRLSFLLSSHIPRAFFKILFIFYFATQHPSLSKKNTLKYFYTLNQS